MVKIPFLLNYIYKMGKRKGINKEKIGLSIDKEVVSDLNKLCSSKLINRSQLVNKLIKNYLEKYKKEIYVEANCMDN